ncbi:nuclear receptor subfamily 0, group B, member 2b [Paramisgurnus dabryanus]|uniref:nuclear receptor subfamily 0, group B, member 2b n=1 Tax=Paramisgurnus dabryanus TaxID=90735 RepID=UPI003CCF2C71
MKKDCNNSKFRKHGILFSILGQKRKRHAVHRSYSGMHSCQCERLVCLRDPETTCTTAFMVLMKTFHFMKNLPSFQHLPVNDHLILLHNHWVPLFILGLAQEGFSFEVQDFLAASILRNILLNSPERNHRYLPTLAEVNNLKSFLKTLWSLDPSIKEYVYIKGAILFNPGVPGLQSSAVIAEHHEELERALLPVNVTGHPRDQHRFTDILTTASSLQTEAQSLVTELFIRPITGQIHLQQLFNDVSQ